MDELYLQAVDRNRGLISLKEQQAIAQARIALPGLGGVGGIFAQTLARLGVRRFHLADFDTFERGNIHRQFCANVDVLGHPKLDVVADCILNIDPGAEIGRFADGVTRENLDAFLDGVDLVLDGLEFFQVKIRRALFNRALERGIPVITSGPMGFSSALLVFMPGGPNFDAYFDVDDNTPELKALASFAIGLAPRITHLKYMDLDEVKLDVHRGPAVAPGVVLCAAVAVTEAVKILTGKGKIRPVPAYAQLDLLRGKWKRGRLWFGMRGPIVRIMRAVMLKRLGFSSHSQDSE